jgi:hypothetical protein
MVTPFEMGRSVRWASGLGTTVVFAWWILTLAAVLL